MPPPRFCVQCGRSATRRQWRVWRGQFCSGCAVKYGKRRLGKIAIAVAAILLAGFAVGRYLRPPPPPLIIERRADSPLSDLPITLIARQKAVNSRTGESDSADSARVAAITDDSVYICGARTKKGTPCRRRVHNAGDRCYQHKGMPAMVPLERLKVEGGR